MRQFRISGVLLEHDLTWDRGGEATPETMRRFYYLAASDLTLKDPPLPTKTERILFWCHATDAGALWNMLKSRDMLPMRGHELCGGEQDEHSIARVLYNTNKWQ